MPDSTRQRPLPGEADAAQTTWAEGRRHPTPGELCRSWYVPDPGRVEPLSSYYDGPPTTARCPQCGLHPDDCRCDDDRLDGEVVE